MKPIPVVFHIGPLQVHTYGIGLAITFWFAYRYFARRLREHGYPDAWLGKAFVWIIIASVAGARAVHVIANWGFYSRNLGDILAVWHGGLSSFGGLALGVPVGLWCARKWCRQLGIVVALDLVGTVLVLAWAIGRLLGPQLMVAGGGRRTSAWYGMYYAGQIGKRVPVPILQAIECFVIWVIAVQVEKFVRRRGGPLGLSVTCVVTLYGLARFFDEYVWLPHGKGGFAVEVVSIIFVGVGVIFAGSLIRRDRHRSPLPGTDPWAASQMVPPGVDRAALAGSAIPGESPNEADSQPKELETLD
ncbi:MAG: prolipoprotein diacylglyceryl transferase [Acidimicrobiales bacterium]